MAEGEGDGRGWRTAVARHWRAILRATALVLVAIVVLQNVEPTTLDILFWSIAEVPKLVLILGSMLVGIAGWEILKALRGR